MILDNIEPKDVFFFFEEICKIPHGSGNTKEISDYFKDFAIKRSLDYYQDDLNNIIIYKKGTKDYENSPAVILQGHLDMVCVKTPNSLKDMELEGIDLEVDGDYISGIETSLGADDGIAGAMILAILDNDELEHPPIEAVLTSDEEIGLIGAAGLDMSKLSAKRLINIDSEEEGVITVSCAGGNRLDIEIPLDIENYHNEKHQYKLLTFNIKGLKGGHSGIEIDKGLANANKLIGRLLDLFSENIDFNLVSINGGNADNAIAKDGEFSILSNNFDEIKDIVKDFEIQINEEFKSVEDEIAIKIIEKDFSDINYLSKESTSKVINFINKSPNGIQSMSKDIEGLVETSLNLGIIKIDEDKFTATFALRSSVEADLADLNKKVDLIAKSFGGKSEIRGAYPPWKFKKESALRDIITEEYKKEYNEKMIVDIIHAGLECGLFSGKIKDLDAISIGPTLEDVHTYNEKMSISSVYRTYNLLLNILKQLK